MPIPFHPRIADSLGRLRTLATGPESYEFLPWSPCGQQAECAARGNIPVLILGLGPCPEALAAALGDAPSGAAPVDVASAPGALHAGAAPPSRTVAWVECPDFERQMTDWSQKNGNVPRRTFSSDLPAHWVRLSPDEAVTFARETRPALWTYRQARRLFPDFWSPLFARLQAAALTAGASGRAASRTVLLPGSRRDLLHLELWDALNAAGFTPLSLPPGGKDNALARLLEKERPAFCLSVNLRGLDPAGETFHLLRALGVPVAVWFADNPWHLLSSLRLPWWKEAALFVTDPTFLPELRRHGAARVYSLPLAASPLFAAREPAALPEGTRVLFVGHSAFPRRDAYFAAAQPPPALLREAEALLDAGGLPHFHWWTERLRPAALWPGNEVREAGAGAEAMSLRHRTLWLEQAAPLGLSVVGDKGWKPVLPPGPLRPGLLPPVDYYTVLPGLYRAAPYSLNVTSLLLPGGLTQRHFDVWRAGGFLLTNRTSGLDLFPSDLVESIVVDAEHTVSDCVDNLESRPALRREIQQEWQKLLAESHTYHHRIQFLQECLNGTLDGPSPNL